jgi:hypothetical protein
LTDAKWNVVRFWVQNGHLLSPNQICAIIMDLDSDKAEYNAYSMEDEEVEPCLPSSISTSSQTPCSPDFSASTSVDEDAVQNIAGQQPQPKQRTLSLCPTRHVCTPGPPKEKSSESAHITLKSPLHLAFCCCSSWMELITLLDVETNRYYQE